MYRQRNIYFNQKIITKLLKKRTRVNPGSLLTKNKFTGFLYSDQMLEPSDGTQILSDHKGYCFLQTLSGYLLAGQQA